LDIGLLKCWNFGFEMAKPLEMVMWFASGASVFGILRLVTLFRHSPDSTTEPFPSGNPLPTIPSRHPQKFIEEVETSFFRTFEITA